MLLEVVDREPVGPVQEGVSVASLLLIDIQVLSYE